MQRGKCAPPQPAPMAHTSSRCCRRATTRFDSRPNGFKTSEIGSVTLNVTETPEVDRMLEVGAQSEQVTVEATAEALQTAKFDARNHGRIRKAVVELPLATATTPRFSVCRPARTHGVATLRRLEKARLDYRRERQRSRPEQLPDGRRGGQQHARIAGVPMTPASMLASAFPTRTRFRSSRSRPQLTMPATAATPAPTSTWSPRSAATRSMDGAFEFFRNEDLNANDFFYNRETGGGKTSRFCVRTSSAATSAVPSRRTRYSFSATIRRPAS